MANETNPFRKGDRVRCVDASGAMVLTKDHEYMVREVVGPHLALDTGFICPQRRFVLVDQPEQGFVMETDRTKEAVRLSGLELPEPPALRSERVRLGLELDPYARHKESGLPLGQWSRGKRQTEARARLQAALESEKPRERKVPFPKPGRNPR